MAQTGTTELAAEVRALYDGEYHMQGQSKLYFDQFCDLRMQMNGQRGNTYNFPILESLQPSTAALSEYDDVTAQRMRANEVTVTLQEFGGAVDVTKFLVATSYVDVYEQAAYANGYSMAESIDMIVRRVVGQGSRVFFPNSRTARTSLEAQTAADRMSAAHMEYMSMLSRTLKMPLFEDNTTCVVMHPFVHHDLLQDTAIRNMSIYSPEREVLFNGEIAYWGGIRIIVAPSAKVFYGGGAARATSVNTTLNGAVAVGDTTIVLTAGTNVSVGDFLAILDATEPGNTWTDTNESFYVTDATTTTSPVGFAVDPGPGDSGGLRYAHSTLRVVRDHSCVYPLTLLGPNSVTKIASSFTGPYGETIITGPLDKLGRFVTFGWYLLAGWGRTRNAWMYRTEVSSSVA